MYEVISKRRLGDGLWEYGVRAPHVAGKAAPGQFVIVRIHEKGERIPLGIADWDRDEGIITLVFRERGKTTVQLAREWGVGDGILDVAGPLGNPAGIGSFGRVICVGEDAWAAHLYPLARALKGLGNEVHLIISPVEFWAERFSSVADSLRFVGDPLGALDTALGTGGADMVWLSGSSGMMRDGSALCRGKGVSVRVFLHPIMLDGTGICGSCRVDVGGEMKLACLDGPEFEGDKVNWDALELRLRAYEPEERLALGRYLGKEAG